MSAHRSAIRHDHIEYAFWLTFDATGGVRMTRNPPAVGRGERAMSLLTKLPKSLFTTPTLSASIVLSDEGVGQMTIDVEAANAALKQALGVDIDLRITPQPSLESNDDTA